jgi:hypothetical protein
MHEAVAKDDDVRQAFLAPVGPQEIAVQTLVHMRHEEKRSTLRYSLCFLFV